MPTPEPNEQKRDCSLPPGCKDLIDAIRAQPQPVVAPLPPITRRIALPEMVAVQYLAELLQMSTHEVSALSGYSVPRSVPFKQAQRILRGYGIRADKATYPNRNIWRRVSAVFVALVALYFISSPVFSLIQGLGERDPGRKAEFTNYLPIEVTVWAILLLIGVALLFGARRLWQQSAS